MAAMRAYKKSADYVFLRVSFQQLFIL